MNWRTWPYWVRGGAIAVPVYIIGIMAVLLLGGEWDSLIGKFILIPMLVAALPALLLLSFFVPTILVGLDPSSGTQLFTYLIGFQVIFVFAFIAEGAFLGWLYGKIKNRTKESSNSQYPSSK